MLRQMMISAALVVGLLVAKVPAQGATKPLTNDDVVTLAKAGLGEDTIIAAIQAQDSNFDISVPALLKLKQDGVTTQVLGAMVAAMGKQRPAAASQPGAAGRQPSASATADITNQAPSTSQTPAAPVKTKRSWLKAFSGNGAVGQALASAGSKLANGSSHAGSSFKSNFLSDFSNAANPQSSAYAAGTSNTDAPIGTSSAFATAPTGSANSYYMSEDGSVMPLENPPQTVQGPRAGTGAPAPAPATPTVASSKGTQAVIMFTPWRDPREGAFTLNVPQGWQVSGGIIRNSALDPRQVVRAASPDGKVQVFIGDPNLIPREVPNQMTAFAGMREGQTMKGAWGGPILLARYQTGEQFARSYVAAQLCRTPQSTNSGVLQDASRQLTASAMAYGRAQGASAQAWVGETNFQCGAQTGYVRASTVLAAPSSGQGVAIWVIQELGGFITADPSQGTVARYILNNMTGSFQLDPQWEARQAQATRDVTGAVTRAQQQMAASIAQNARQQAQSNQIDVMSGWEKRNKVMDGIRQRDSETRLGITTVTDDVQGSHTVSNDYNYYWTRPDGSIVGTLSGNPPDYSSGWRMMQKSN
jgi:hypothetical protein